MGSRHWRDGADDKYKQLFKAIEEECALRKIGSGFVHEDPRGRDTTQILAAIRAKSPWWPEDFEIRGLTDAEFPPPPPALDHETFFSVLKHVVSDVPNCWFERGGESHRNYQVTLSSDHRADGGGYYKLLKWTRDIFADGNDPTAKITSTDWSRALTVRAFGKWLKAVFAALREAGKQTCQWHGVFYEEGGKTTCHRDKRLTEASTWRIIFVAPDPPGRAATPKWLTFYLGQDDPPQEDGRPGGFNRHGAYCLGQMKSSVLGAGGVEIIPAGVVDLSGKWKAKGYKPEDYPPVYMYHEPFTKTGAPAKAASYVFSGKALALG